jgi:hypothetical protein
LRRLAQHRRQQQAQPAMRRGETMLILLADKAPCAALFFRIEQRE